MKPIKKLIFDHFTIGPQEPFALIAGPCVIEDPKLLLDIATELKQICQELNIPLLFKASYDKANRSSVHSFRGPGIKEGLPYLEMVKEKLDIPIFTDIHTPEEAIIAGAICDMIQIPAFLCRQTDLVIAAAKTQKPINIKKGQFMAPWDLKNVIEKVTSQGNHQILLCDRGTSFGYNNLVCDMRGIPIMKSMGYPVCFDATHAVQLPGGNGTHSGGQREFVYTLAKAAIASGADSLYIETHPNPQSAPSDGANMLPLQCMKPLLKNLKALHELVQNQPSVDITCS